MRATALIALAAGCLALAGVASATGPFRAVTAASPLRVVFKPLAPGPKVKVKWPYRLVVTLAGKPVAGRLTATLVDPIGQQHQVNDDAEKPIKNRLFRKGVFTDKILFPVESKGFPLKLRFAVTVGKAKKVLEVTVTPK